MLETGELIFQTCDEESLKWSLKEQNIIAPGTILNDTIFRGKMSIDDDGRVKASSDPIQFKVLGISTEYFEIPQKQILRKFNFEVTYLCEEIKTLPNSPEVGNS